jgi:hypothetical protein
MIDACYAPHDVIDGRAQAWRGFRKRVVYFGETKQGKDTSPI